MKNDPNLKAAARLLARSAYVMNRHETGRPMTRRQAKQYLGCAPEDVLERIADLTSHIAFCDPAGNVISPAHTRQ